MAEIIEILFEDILFDELSNYLIEGSAESTLLNYQISVDNFILKEKFNNLSSLVKNFNYHKEGSLYLKFENFKLDRLVFIEVGIQILKYNDQVDISLDVDYKYFKEIGSISIIHSWAEIFSQRLRAKTYFCGYEPATDEDTRFFTANKLGPLKLKKENT